jgi:hypothetical protein
MNPTAHVTEEDLILLYYSEAPDVGRIEQHLGSCSACRGEFERLKRVMALVDAEGFSVVEAPRAGFERDVWARLEPQLSRPRSWFSRLFPSPGRLAFAGAAAAVVIVAFLAGRFSKETPPAAAPVTTTASADVTERVLVVAVVDHLDRSQMVLLEVMNGEAGDQTTFSEEQSLARELVASSRLYRQTAVRTGDDRTGDVLDELERALVEIANTPQDATPEELEALRAGIASRGLLFKVRVVHSEMVERERQTLRRGSTS